MQQKTYLITGASGLVGRHVMLALIEQGHVVHALIRSEAARQKLKDIIKSTPELANRQDLVVYVEGDILDVYALEEAVKSVDGVFHCAATVSFEKSKKDEILHVNIQGTANVVNAMLQVNPSAKLCHVSSIAAFGRTEEEAFITEETHWTSNKNSSVYSVSKYLSECEVWRGYQEGLAVVVVNPSVIIGPGNWQEGSAALIRTVAEGLKFYTRGSNGYVDVRDVADVMCALMKSDINGERFLLSAENLPYKVFFTKIAQALQCEPPSIYAGKVLSGLAWRFEWLRGLLTGRTPVITKETARTAYRRYYYSGEKISRFIPFSYRSMDDTIRDTCRHYLNDVRSRT